MLRSLGLVSVSALLGLWLALSVNAAGYASPWAYEDPTPTPTTELGEDSLRIGAEFTTPDEPGRDSTTSSESARDGGTVNTVAWTPPPGIPPWVTPVERCLASDDNGYAMECTGAQPATPAVPPAPGTTATTPGTPGITIRDVATFRPELASLSSEPEGWAVRGLAANFLAAGGSSSRSGTLLGATAEVRFTPVAWRFDYGDGTAPRTTATPGGTWQALGLDEFDETATSHVYETSGSFTVSLLVDYAAEYRVGGSGPFVPIPGTLAIPSPSIQMVVADSATTALVGRDCVENPRGPGC